MPNIFNQYSYVFFSLGALLVGLVVLRAVLRLKWPVILLGGVVLAGVLTAGWFILRPGSSDVSSLEAAEAMIDSGKPTFVEFFSNYCAGCMAARTMVDDLVADMDTRFGDQVNVLRVDIHTDFGRALRERYGFSYTPEFVLFDNRGMEVWRSHVPPTTGEIESMMSLRTVTETSG
jgi:thiol-disulfide isomerase/thioredoxin